MEKRTCYYVSRKNALAWLMALCMVCSAVTRIVFADLKGFGTSQQVWSQIVLPAAAAVLFVLIVLLNGKEKFYKTAIPVWMLAVYFGFAFDSLFTGRLMKLLYWIVLLCFAAVYTTISAGRSRKIGILFLVFLFPLAMLLYGNRQVILAADTAGICRILPDVLALLGGCILVLAVRIHPHGEYHPTWGDRSDGRRLRTLPPMSQVSPYIMVNRNGSNNLFTDSFEITQVDRYIRQKRREGLTGFGIMHVLLAAYCRGVAKYPALNRFLSGQKVYSRGNDIQFCITVKKEMRVDSPDTVIKVHLTPRDTAEDVYRKVNVEVDKVKNSPLDSDFDNTAGILTMLPGVFLKFTVWVLKTMDYFGLLPGFLLEVSPFHGSIFLTSMGSLGIPPVFHHLYDFGNLPVFGAFGMKRHELELQEDGSVLQRKYVDCNFTLDERIVDGYYYAAFFKYYKRLVMHPEVLDTAPETVAQDIN